MAVPCASRLNEPSRRLADGRNSRRVHSGRVGADEPAGAGPRSYGARVRRAASGPERRGRLADGCRPRGSSAGRGLARRCPDGYGAAPTVTRTTVGSPPDATSERPSGVSTSSTNRYSPGAAGAVSSSDVSTGAPGAISIGKGVATGAPCRRHRRARRQREPTADDDRRGGRGLGSSAQRVRAPRDGPTAPCPRFTTRTPSENALGRPRARTDGAAWMAPSKSPVTRTTSDGNSAWVAAS